MKSWTAPMSPAVVKSWGFALRRVLRESRRSSVQSWY
jgi:hypothetical protein